MLSFGLFYLFKFIYCVVKVLLLNKWFIGVNVEGEEDWVERNCCVIIV